MYRSLLFVSLFLGSYAALLPDTDSKNEDAGILFDWERFKSFHGKQYGDNLEKERKHIYLRNCAKIVKHNEEYERGVHSYALEMNHFGDFDSREFVRLMNGLQNVNESQASSRITFMTPHFFAPPKELDWRTKGYVTPVKNQGHCGSCWAFSATGALEGQTFRKTGKLPDLSEQNLIDCSKKYGNDGCNGGLMDQAFEYVKDNKGLDTETAYPYEANDGKCRFKKDGIGAKDSGFVDIEEGSEQKLQEAIAAVGPVSIAIDASHESFQFYSKGVYDEKECSSEDLDHGVLAVGYGSDANGKDFWIVKNSWGEEWGDGGYIKMTRNKKNQCGVASKASYPIV